MFRDYRIWYPDKFIGYYLGGSVSEALTSGWTRTVGEHPVTTAHSYEVLREARLGIRGIFVNLSWWLLLGSGVSALLSFGAGIDWFVPALCVVGAGALATLVYAHLLGREGVEECKLAERFVLFENAYLQVARLLEEVGRSTDRIHYLTVEQLRVVFNDELLKRATKVLRFKEHNADVPEALKSVEKEELERAFNELYALGATFHLVRHNSKSYYQTAAEMRGVPRGDDVPV